MHVRVLNTKKVIVISMGLTAATATHTSIFIVSTVGSVCVMSAVGQSLFCANTGKIVQVDGTSPRAKCSSENGSAVCWINQLVP